MRHTIRLGTLAFACSLAAMPVNAQTRVPMLTGDNVDDIVSIARQFGSAAISRQQTGDPLIAGRIDNIPYAVRFLNCDRGGPCEDLNFRVGFQAKPASDLVNAWNAGKRFSRAYLDGEGDVILEMDAVISGGVSQQALVQIFDYWRLSLDQFIGHIGFE